MKICNKCDAGNEVMHYRKICKACYRQEVLDYKKTVKGVVSVIYHNQINNTRKRGMEDVSYTQSELQDFLVDETNFMELYTAWVSSDYLKDLKPSVDRDDDYKSYSLDNIQVMTQEEHFAKSGLDRVEGFNLKASTPVYGIAQDGSVTEYFSIHEAARQTNSHYTNIWNVCMGNRKSAAKHKWRFKYEQ